MKNTVKIMSVKSIKGQISSQEKKLEALSKDDKGREEIEAYIGLLKEELKNRK